MSDAAIYDSLTGAYSRALLSEQLHTEVERARRYNAPCSLMLFDLDHFKSINDAFGHARGDEVLREVARRVRATIRASDQLFRYGGDEFVVLLPNTAKADAAHLAQRLLDTVRATRFEGAPPLSLTLSLGVATCPEDGNDQQALFEKADARNYQAKRRGRARVVADDAGEAAALPFAEVSRLSERDQALDAAKEFLAAIETEQRGVLSIVGAAGTGRSRLIAEVEKRARLLGFDVIGLRGTRALKTQAYGALAALRQELFGGLPSPFSAAAFAEALQQRLAARSCDRMLLSIDDLPLLDWGTLDLLRQLLAMPGIPILGLIYAADLESARLAPPFLAPLRERVTLQPLSRAGLHMWLRALMQWELPIDFVDWLHGQTDGLPAQVERVLTHLLKQGTLARNAAEWTLNPDHAALDLDGVTRPHRPPPHNLPAALTSFIGRERELAEARRLLATTRLLTLTGAGGAGKTRLSLHVAGELLDSFSDGVWFVDLAPLGNPRLVLLTIASALGVREEHGRPLSATLIDWLRPKQVLIILDNCEHLLDACAQFADAALRAGPQLRILATSREALDIEGETSYRVPSLSLPPIASQADAARGSIGDIGQYEAVRLFVDRALAVQPAFETTAADALDAIAQICQRLDGIPLAIELAAARIKTLTAAQIVAQLDDRFNLLTSGRRMALPRQQTLRALIDWSYNLLSDAERVLLRRLSVFSGGWTGEAAEAVCADFGLPIHPCGVPDFGLGAEAATIENRVPRRGESKIQEAPALLANLVGKSLVVLDEQAAAPRYRMLETIRQYAREKLLEAQESEQLRDRHLNYYMHLSERAEPSLLGARRAIWVRRLEAEHDNIRAALERASEQSVETARWLAGTLRWFWYFGDHLNEGQAWFGRVLALDEDATPKRGLARALCGAGMVSANLGATDEARPWLEQSIALLRALGERELMTESVFSLGYALVQVGQDERACALFADHEALLRASAIPMILGWSLSYWGRALAHARGDYAAARALHDESVAVGQAAQDPAILATAFMNLGHWAAEQGDYASGQRYHGESLARRRQAGTQLHIAISSHYVADMLSMQGAYQEAQPLYAEALALSRALGDQAFIAWTCYRLGYLATHQGAYARAAALFAESLNLYRAQQTEQELITSCLAGCAELRRAKGQLAQAARVLGYVSAHPQSAQRLFVYGVDRSEYERTVSALRAQLDVAIFDTAWAEGQTTTIDRAIAYALNENAS
jgi:diguanylate cyclase (GGDEF)-like protein